MEQEKQQEKKPYTQEIKINLPISPEQSVMVEQIIKSQKWRDLRLDFVKKTIHFRA